MCELIASCMEKGCEKGYLVFTALCFCNFIFLFRTLRHVCSRHRQERFRCEGLWVHGKCCWAVPVQDAHRKVLSGGNCSRSDANPFLWDASAGGYLDSKSPSVCGRSFRIRRGHCCLMKGGSRCRGFHSGRMVCSRTKEALCPTEAEEGFQVQS